MIDIKPLQPGELRSLAGMAAYEADQAMAQARKLAIKAEEWRQAALAAGDVPASPVEEVLPSPLPPPVKVVLPPPPRGRRRSPRTAKLKAAIVRDFKQKIITNPRFKDTTYYDLAVQHGVSASYVKRIVLAHQKKEREWPYQDNDTALPF